MKLDSPDVGLASGDDELDRSTLLLVPTWS